MPTGKIGRQNIRRKTIGAAYLTCTNLDNESTGSVFAICTTILTRQGHDGIVFGAKVITDEDMAKLLN